jgi:hypothetical protein
MTAPASLCPGCGAPVRFLWSSAVQTACPYCKAILVRRDVDLERVGTVADLPPDASPIQIGTEGVFENRAFTVVGRIAYAWDQGHWNEWHLAFNDGSGWLSDAQAAYAVSRAAVPDGPLPPAGQIRRGQEVRVAGAFYQVTTLTHARYEGFEGDLPFATYARAESLFADLRTTDGRFGTIDYSEDPPLLYLGKAVTFDELRLKGLREFEGW